MELKSSTRRSELSALRFDFGRFGPSVGGEEWGGSGNLGAVECTFNIPFVLILHS